MATAVIGQTSATPAADTSLLSTLWRPAALIVFAVWALVVGSHHEPWFDEAQAWLLARDNDLWTLLSQRVRYEGTPGLWHLILWFAIRAGLPYSQLYLLPSAFGIAGAAVVLWRSPFPSFLRLAVLGSYFFGYQFSVIARSYSVELFLVPLAAAFFASRIEKPLRYALVVGLIANANSHSFLIAGILGLELAWRLWEAGKWRDGRSLAALALAAGLGLAALATAYQPADNNYLQADIRSKPWVSAISYLTNAFIDRISFWSSGQKTVGDVLVGLGLSLILQRPFFLLVLAGRNRLLSTAILVTLIVFSVLIYSSAWHAGLLFLFWLFLLWVQWDVTLSRSTRRELILTVSAICLLQTVETVRAGLWDVSNRYSPGQEAARALTAYREQHPQNRIAGFGFKAFEVQPWLSGNPFDNYHERARKPAYIRWDRQEAWSARVKLPLWQQLLDTRPDLILASQIDLAARRRNLMPQACQAGYGVRQKFPAMLTWRGVVAEDQTLILFERGSTNGCKS